jgi:hypothetical protein
MINTKEIVENMISDWNIIKKLYEGESNEVMKAKYLGMLEQMTRTFGYKLREDVYENHSELNKTLYDIGLDNS